MEYKLKTPITKVDGEKIEVVEVKESFTGRDVRAIGNSDGQGSAVIALVLEKGMAALNKIAVEKA